MSPRSTRISVCFGKISEPSYPSMTDICFNFDCIKDAGIFSLVNKKTCAPPDLDRQTIKGRLSFRILLMRLRWSKLYSSISIHPQRQVLSLVIGMMPSAAPLPSRWLLHKSLVTSPLTIKALPFCLPFSPRSPG